MIVAAGTCSEPQTPTNGQKIGSDYSLGAQVTFSCNDGYSLVGSSSLNCAASGSTVDWDAAVPTCQGIIDIIINRCFSAQLTSYLFTFFLLGCDCCSWYM